MKWYCNKNYVPQTGVDMLIRAKHPEGYERYFVACTEYYLGREKLNNWEMTNGAYHDIDFSLYEVTHFMPFDPVLVED